MDLSLLPLIVNFSRAHADLGTLRAHTYVCARYSGILLRNMPSLLRMHACMRVKSGPEALYFTYYRTICETNGPDTLLSNVAWLIPRGFAPFHCHRGPSGPPSNINVAGYQAGLRPFYINQMSERSERVIANRCVST